MLLHGVLAARLNRVAKLDRHNELIVGRYERRPEAGHALHGIPPLASAPQHDSQVRTVSDHILDLEF